MKKFLAPLIFISCVCLFFTGCGDNNSPDTSSTSSITDSYSFPDDGIARTNLLVDSTHITIRERLPVYGNLDKSDVIYTIPGDVYDVTVEIITRLNDNWYLVEYQKGKQGFVQVNFDLLGE